MAESHYALILVFLLLLLIRGRLVVQQALLLYAGVQQLGEVRAVQQQPAQLGRLDALIADVVVVLDVHLCDAD